MCNLIKKNRANKKEKIEEKEKGIIKIDSHCRGFFYLSSVFFLVQFEKKKEYECVDKS